MAKEWLTYEEIIGKKTRRPLEAMCAYNISQIESNEVFFKLLQTHQNTVTAKNMDFVNNEEICSHTITEELERILGVNSTELIFCFLEKRLNMSRNQIIVNTCNFNEGLEQILGEGALSIEKHILKKIHNKLEVNNTSVEI